MANTTKLSAEKRTESAKSAVKQLRKEGRTPGVVYGEDVDGKSMPIHISESEMLRMMQHGETVGIIKLSVDGKQYSVITNEIQRDPLKGQLIHVDFHQVNMNEPIVTEVPIHLEGKPLGVADGGVLQQQLRTIEVRCLPSKLPDMIHANIEQLAIGDVLSVSSLELPEGVEPTVDPETVVASVQAPQLEVVEDEETDEAADAEVAPEAKADKESKDEA